MDNKIDELEYLMNPSLYEKWMDGVETNDNEFKQELKFYRKRIIQMTKDMMKSDYENKSLHPSFIEYCKCCIEYFKGLDKKDILQEEYKNLIENNLEFNQLSEIEGKEPDSVLMNPNYIQNKGKINDYWDIKKINCKKSENIKIPVQKELCLKNPSLKVKGIKNKKKKKKELNPKNLEK